MAQPDRSIELKTIDQLFAYMMAWATAGGKTNAVNIFARDGRSAVVWFIACCEARSFYDSTVKEIARTLVEGVKIDTTYVSVWLETVFEDVEIEDAYKVIDDLLAKQYLD